MVCVCHLQCVHLFAVMRNWVKGRGFNFKYAKNTMQINIKKLFNWAHYYVIVFTVKHHLKCNYIYFP